MKKSIYFLLFAVVPLLTASTFIDTARNGDEDLIVGKWKPSNGLSVVSIYKGKSEDGEDSNKYYGKIIWLKQANDDDGNPRKDVNNPESKLRSNTVKGLVIIKDMEFDEVDGKTITWEGGTIYDPNNGLEYSFEAEINKKDEDIMNGRGFIGVSLFGRTDTWTRLVRK